MMQKEDNPSRFAMETAEAGFSKDEFDEDGRPKRTGTWFSAGAHIITAVIGSGVLSLGWAVAQLGWIAGPIAVVIFSIITWYTSCLLADAYRSPLTGKRNYTYMDAVKNNLGGSSDKYCGTAQYVNLVGTSIGYTITASISMAAILRSNCFHKNGHNAGCHTSNNKFMIIFAVIEVILSQTPNFHKLDALSVIAAVMSFTYAGIGLGLSAVQVAQGPPSRTSLTGTTVGIDVTSAQKVWNTLGALGNIAFAYAFSQVLIEIQDTLKAGKPENKEMKKATTIGVIITSIFYLACGVLGYGAFGNSAPGNFLTGFGFYEPFWLIDIANVCIIIHLVGAYQVFAQPIYRVVEDMCGKQWPNSVVTKEMGVKLPFLGVYNVNIFRITWRTSYVMLTSLFAMLFPFFNSVLGLLGALVFWPLTVYFPIEMYIKMTNINPFSFNGIWLRILSGACFIISILAAVGSLEGIYSELRAYKPFNSIS